MTEEAKRNQEKWDLSEAYFKAEFPDHEDGCLYGKIVVKAAYTAGRESRDEYIKKLLQSNIDQHNKISFLSSKVQVLQKQNTEAKEIISKLCFVIHAHEDDYNIRGLMQKAKAFLKE